MYKLVELKCTNCEHQFEEMIDTNDCGTAECPLCHHPSVQTIGLSCHGKHLSWASWRTDQGIKG